MNTFFLCELLFLMTSWGLQFMLGSCLIVSGRCLLFIGISKRNAI